MPELEALMRWAMVLYNQYPWHRQHTHTSPVLLTREHNLREGVPTDRKAGTFIVPVLSLAQSIAGDMTVVSQPRKTFHSAKSESYTENLRFSEGF